MKFYYIFNLNICNHYELKLFIMEFQAYSIPTQILPVPTPTFP